MRVSIHTLGTRGDLQPHLALALGDTTMAKRAKALGADIAAEDGVGRAIAFLRQRGLLPQTRAEANA